MLITACAAGAMLLSAASPACPATVLTAPSLTAPCPSPPGDPAGPPGQGDLRPPAAACNWSGNVITADQLAADATPPWVDFVHSPPDRRLQSLTPPRHKWDLSPLEETLITALYLALFVALINFMVRNRPRRFS